MSLSDDTEDPETIFLVMAPFMLHSWRTMCEESPLNREAMAAFATYCRDGDTMLSAEQVKILQECYVIEADGSIRDYVKALITHHAIGEGHTFRLITPALQVH
jgi:hypothetical protein